MDLNQADSGTLCRRTHYSSLHGKLHQRHEALWVQFCPSDFSQMRSKCSLSVPLCEARFPVVNRILPLMHKSVMQMILNVYLWNSENYENHDIESHEEWLSPQHLLLTHFHKYLWFGANSEAVLLKRKMTQIEK